MKIPIVFAVNNNYIKYLSITIQSIYENNMEDEFWMYVFFSNISLDNQIKLLEMQNENVHIKFVDVHDKIDSEILFVDGHVTEETYYRLLIPELLPQWDKVLWMDCDVVCLKDISKLYSLNMDENWVGGVITVGNENRAEYTKTHLGISSDNYINAGILLFNNAELRKIEWKKMWMQCIKDKKYFKWHDQDLLNILCDGKILFLDSKWNTTVLRMKKNLGVEKEQSIRCEDIDCNILHYASSKPWETEMMAVNLPFWKYVYSTPFATEIVSEYDEISNSRKHFTNLCKKGMVSLKMLMDCLGYSIGARIINGRKLIATEEEKKYEN